HARIENRIWRSSVVEGKTKWPEEFLDVKRNRIERDEWAIDWIDLCRYLFAGLDFEFDPEREGDGDDEEGGRAHQGDEASAGTSRAFSHEHVGERAKIKISRGIPRGARIWAVWNIPKQNPEID